MEEASLGSYFTLELPFLLLTILPPQYPVSALKHEISIDVVYLTG